MTGDVDDYDCGRGRETRDETSLLPTDSRTFREIGSRDWRTIPSHTHISVPWRSGHRACSVLSLTQTLLACASERRESVRKGTTRDPLSLSKHLLTQLTHTTDIHRFWFALLVHPFLQDDDDDEDCSHTHSPCFHTAIEWHTHSLLSPADSSDH